MVPQLVTLALIRVGHQHQMVCLLLAAIGSFRISERSSSRPCRFVLRMRHISKCTDEATLTWDSADPHKGHGVCCWQAHRRS